MGLVKHVGPPSQAIHKASPTKVCTSHPAVSIAALVPGKPAIMMHLKGDVGNTFKLRPLLAINSSLGASINSIPIDCISW